VQGGRTSDEALQHHPHFIACDAGTTDAGFSLGPVVLPSQREAVKRDLAISRCGTQRGSTGVDWLCRDFLGMSGRLRCLILQRNVKGRGKLRTAVIYAETRQGPFNRKAAGGEDQAARCAPHLDEDNQAQFADRWDDGCRTVADGTGRGR